MQGTHHDAGTLLRAGAGWGIARNQVFEGDVPPVQGLQRLEPFEAALPRRQRLEPPRRAEPGAGGAGHLRWTAGAFLATFVTTVPGVDPAADPDVAALVNLQIWGCQSIQPSVTLAGMKIGPSLISVLRVLLVGLSLSLSLVLSPVAPVAPAFASKPGPAPVPLRVCLDAGHGGSDSGAVHYGLQEKHLTLDIAHRLKDLLLNAGLGFSVVMTRTGDETLGNTERAMRCNDGHADAVLSIHLNASSDPRVDYFQAFYGKQTKDAAFTQTISDTYALTKPGSPELLPKQPITNFASGLLLKTNAPACLAETVFLSNPDEAKLLADGTGSRQQAIAQQLFSGVKAWYRL